VGCSGCAGSAETKVRFADNTNEGWTVSTPAYNKYRASLTVWLTPRTVFVGLICLVGFCLFVAVAKRPPQLLMA
jgi:hypothetical protein